MDSELQINEGRKRSFIEGLDSKSAKGINAAFPATISDGVCHELLP